MITLHDVEQGSEEWDALRADFYTGTSAEKVLEHSTKTKYVNGVSTPYAVNIASTFKGNFYTKRGHALEDEAIDLLQAITKEVGIRLESGRKVGFVTNSKFQKCGYSPDDLYPDHTVEVKAFNKEKHLQLINGNIPFKILAQIHYGMLICGVKFCHFIPYNPDFAKKQLVIDGELVDNPDYDPKKAFKIITIKYNPKIAANFKRVLAAPKATV